jgi:hypothetical protein
LRLGINLEENFENTHDYNIAINYTVQPANSLGAEWRNDLTLGENLRLFTEYWQPLDAESRWFVAPSFEFRRESFPVYSGNNQTGEFILRDTNLGSISAAARIGERCGPACSGILDMSARFRAPQGSQQTTFVPAASMCASPPTRWTTPTSRGAATIRGGPLGWCASRSARSSRSRSSRA